MSERSIPTKCLQYILKWKAPPLGITKFLVILELGTGGRLIPTVTIDRFHLFKRMQRPRVFLFRFECLIVFNEYFRKGTLKTTLSWQARQREERFKVNLGIFAKALQKSVPPSARKGKEGSA